LEIEKVFLRRKSRVMLKRFFTDLFRWALKKISRFARIFKINTQALKSEVRSDYRQENRQEINGNKNATFGIVKGGKITINYDYNAPLHTTEENFQIVSLTIIERKPFPVIDVKLLNRDKDPILIHKIELVILSSQTYFDEIKTSPVLASSHVYHILLDPAEVKSVVREASFVVNQHSADRFHVVVGTGHSSRDGKVELQGQLRLYYNKNQTRDSEIFNISVYIDHHFSPAKASDILNTQSYFQKVSENIDVLKNIDPEEIEHLGRSYLGADGKWNFVKNPNILRDLNTEEIDILTQLNLKAKNKLEAEKLCLNILHKGNDIPTLVQASISLMRLGNSIGLEWLINAVSENEPILWKRIIAVRHLIYNRYLERSTYIEIIRGSNIAMKLEVIRVLGFLRDNSVVPELSELIRDIDNVIENSLKVYFSENAKSFLNQLGILDARRNYELEEIVRALGYIGDQRGISLIEPIINSESTYKELSYNLLVACIEALGNIGGAEAIKQLEAMHQRLSNLIYPSSKVKQAIISSLDTARNNKQPQTIYGIEVGLGRDFSNLVFAREKDDFPINWVGSGLETLLRSDSIDEKITEWFRGDDCFSCIMEFMNTYQYSNASSVNGVHNVHFHNKLPDLIIPGKWRKHPLLQNKFHPDYPDDIQVIVHEGGPRVSKQRPELMWVSIIAQQDDVYVGILLNKPHNLTTVKQGEKILFLVSETSEYPFRITEKYLAERNSWEMVYPCNKCGFSELFDPPSELFEKVFPSQNVRLSDIPKDATVVAKVFTALCPICGGIQCINMEVKAH